MKNKVRRKRIKYGYKKKKEVTYECRIKKYRTMWENKKLRKHEQK